MEHGWRSSCVERWNILENTPLECQPTPLSLITTEPLSPFRLPPFHVLGAPCTPTVIMVIRKSSLCVPVTASCGCWRIIYVIAACCSLWIPSAEAALAASGGGGGGRGFGSGSRSSSLGRNTKTTTTTTSDSGTTTEKQSKKKNKRNRVLADLLLMDLAVTQQQQAGSSADPTTKEQQQQSVPKSPALDKWGLPPPTLDDIFPPPSADTKIVAATRDKYDLADIQAALKGYIELDLSRAWETCTKVTLVHESPPVLVLDDFLTADECREIQQVAGLVQSPPLGGGAAEEESSLSKDLRRRIFPSPVQIPSATMSTTLAQSVRTSTSWFCHYASVSTLLVKMEQLLGIHLAVVEEPQIVRYRPFQQFSWHYDHLPTTQLANGGQRLATVLVYLNDCPDAPTVFRDLHGTATTSEQQEGEQPPLAVVPVMGRALLFFPAFADGEPDERTLHCGQPAVVEEKHMIQCWVHQLPYTAALPPGNRQSDVDRVGTRRRLGYESYHDDQQKRMGQRLFADGPLHGLSS
jgi:prolyl 4-hydroxylase